MLGSRGSLLSVLAEQLRNNVPMTVTHPDMTRFFMTIEEAAGLVVEAAHLAGTGEIFVLDMGEPVRILDVVQSFAHLMHHPDVEVRFTGMREGEKLNESLFSEHEQALPTAHPRIFRTISEQRSWGCTRSCAACTTPPRATTPRPCGATCAHVAGLPPQVPTCPARSPSRTRTTTEPPATST